MLTDANFLSAFHTGGSKEPKAAPLRTK
jgi:hypothetical protein